MIIKFKAFENINDPYDEKNWLDLPSYTDLSYEDFMNMASDDILNQFYKEYSNEYELTSEEFYYSNVKYWSKRINVIENIEYLEEMDPYGEEDWDDSTVFLPGDEVIITPKLKEYDDILPKWFMDFIGKKTFIYDNKIRHNQRMVGMAVDAKFYVDEESKVKAYFIPIDCLEKVNI